MRIEACDCPQNCGHQIQVATTNKLIDHERYPLLKEEFVSFVTKPHLILEMLMVGSSQRANWKCQKCAHEWVTDVGSRARDSTNCNICSSKQTGMKQMLTRGQRKPTVNMAQAIEVIGHPEIPATVLSANSNKAVMWQCRCGIKFKQKMYQANANNPKLLCNTCRRGQSSRIEYEIKFLLEAYLPSLTFKDQYKKDSYPKIVDIYVEDFDLALELDPFRFHADKAESDTRILGILSEHYTKALRVRDARLPEVEGSLVVKTNDKWRNLFSPLDWSESIVNWLVKEYPLVPLSLSDQEKNAALVKANTFWDAGLGEIKTPVSSEKYAPEFVANITHPGRKPEYTLRTSNDDCLWKCPRCEHVYKQRVARRTEGIDCPKHKGEKISAGRLNSINAKRLITSHPNIFSELQSVVGEPDYDLKQITPSHPGLCVFVCSNGHKYERKMLIRTTRNNRGCPVCLKQTGSPHKMEDKDRFCVRMPDVFKEYVRNLDHPLKDPNNLRHNSTDKCEWHCGNINHSVRIKTPYYRTRGYGHCKECVTENQDKNRTSDRIK